MRKDVKNITPSVRRRHIWKSFSVRIEQVQIDVARRIKRVDTIEEETESYFVSGLHKWSELNLTIPFTEFLQEVDKKAKTLAQVVHHQEDIFTALSRAISKGDQLSLNAVLNLLVQFIRDLQGDFEVYVTRTIKLLTSDTLIRHSSVEVIEATFTTFAYLFKYLQRTLSTNPIPTFDAFAGLLGRNVAQKPYIVRFAAESLSFLLRRTRSSVQAEFLQHVCEDVRGIGRAEYTEGVSFLLAETIKGVDHSLHAKGLLLFQSYLDVVTKTLGDRSRTDTNLIMLENVTINLLHHCTRESYRPVLNVYSALMKNTTEDLIDLGWRMCFISCAVRKGTRIEDWAQLLSLTSSSLEAAVNFDCWNAVRFTSVLFTYAPHEAILAHSTSILKLLQASRCTNILLLSEILAKQQQSNFVTFVLPQYRRCIVNTWSTTNIHIYVRSIINIAQLGAFSADSSVVLNDRLRVNPQIVSDVVALINATIPTIETQSELLTLVSVTNCIASTGDFDATLLQLIRRIFEARVESTASRQLALLLGSTLEQLAKTTKMPQQSSVPDFASHTGLWRSPGFLKGYALFARRYDVVHHDEAVSQILINNLGATGHARRLHSLQILQQLDLGFTELDRDLLSVCEIVESTDLTLDATRALAMQIRKLNQNYPLLNNNTTKSIIASFSRGLLTTNYTPFWSFCCETLARVAETDSDLVWSLARDWFFEAPIIHESTEETQDYDSDDRSVKEASMDCFKCFNTAELRQNCVDARAAVDNVNQVGLRSYATQVSQAQEVMTVSRRSQAMRIFTAIPEVAERHSRELVPVFISQFGTIDVDDDDIPEDEQVQDIDSDRDISDTASEMDLVADETDATTETGRFNKKERNDLLTLFSKFNNPSAFVNATRVRDIVMDLLASRDSRTQNLAFEIVLHYRDSTLRKYEDNLKNLLSDSRSRDEITTFLQTDAEESQIEDQHRSHVMPVVARILYGKMINRRHATSQKKGLANSRNIILGAVASMGDADIREFITIFLISFTNISLVDKSSTSYILKDISKSDVPSLRKQIGFCTMIQDALVQLAGKVQPYVGNVLDALICCFLSAQKIIDHPVEVDQAATPVEVKIARNIRQSVYHTLDLMFQYCRAYDWKPYMNIIFQLFVDPRLSALPVESSQNPSGLLKLLSNWASSSVTSPLLVQYNDAVLPTIFDCLAEKSIKDPVAIFVLTIVQNICDQVKDEDIVFENNVRKALLPNKVELFLGRMSVLLEHQKYSSTNNTINSDFLELEISVLSSISSLVSGSSAVQTLLDLLMPLLSKPRKVVSEQVKEGILNIVENFLPLSQDYITVSDTLWKKYNAIGSLFASSSSRKSRTSLTSIMRIFSRKNKSLILCAQIIEDLNAFSTRRLDTPDFDRRLAAFASLNEEQYQQLSPMAWRPLLYNMIFFVGDEEELALRTNATYSIRRLLEVTKSAAPPQQEQFLRVLETDLYPAIKKGVRHQSELIRQEWVGVLGATVKECSFWSQVSDLVPLLVGDDEEANFFYNILHIQQHRRMRALRRLATISQKHEIQSNNIAQIILPMIEHYCFMPKEESHNLTAETIKTIGQLAQAMKFNQYSALLKRYIGLLKPNETSQATVVRLIGSVVDALVGTPDVATDLVDYMQDDEDEMDVELEVNSTAQIEQDSTMKDDEIEHRKIPQLQATKPSSEKYNELISNSFLPHLTKYLHSKDDETVALRVPIALTVVKLLTALPHEALTMKLPGVLTDVCHILRSRSQDARDMTRKTLGLIATLLGPKYFSYILAELKSALQRGYQLHVLGFSVHTILVKLQPEYATLDYCLNQLVDMLIDDIFGETGLEKEAEDYISKMKEMKTTKSYDSFEILASTTKLTSLGEILWPLKTLLAETSSIKVIRKVDEVCRRLTLGILRNKECNTRDSLLFCYNIYQQTMSSTQQKAQKMLSILQQARKDAEKNYVVDLKARKSFVRDHFKANAHKLLKFSLETLRSILQKFTDLQTAENLAAFVPVIGDSMMSGYDDVHISALRLLSQIVKVDLSTLDSGAPVFLEQAVAFIKASPSTKTELCQASLKFISIILKERKSVTMKDAVLAYLLVRIKADLEEPDRQGVTFSILRSIMSRKFMVPELYDIMDEVGNMMVTNQSAGPRDTARSAYYQFLLDYPQGKGRLKKQIAFLVKNLEYVHSSGRKSVMEALNLIITHFDDSILQEYLMILFFASTMALINDDDAGCREMSGALIRKILQRADEERLKSIVAALRSWAFNDQALLQRASVQGFGLLFEVKENRKDDSKFFMERLALTIKQAVDKDVLADGQDDEADDEQDTSTEWQILYYGLQTFTKILTKSPEVYIAKKHTSLWEDIQKLLLYHHAWIRLSVARLVGVVFLQRQKTTSGELVCGRDLALPDVRLVRIARQSLIQLRSPLLSNDLSTQITKNLIFLLRFFNDNGTVLPPRDDVEQVEEDEEEQEKKSTCTEWLLRRVATLLQSDRDVKRETHMLVRRSLLQFFAVAIQSLSSETLQVHGHIVARPIYKYAEMQTHNADQNTLRDLALEVFELFKNKVGQTRYAEIYNDVRQAQMATRQERKQKRTIENVRFPERGAMKKVKASLKKREKRAEVAGSNKKRREMRAA